MTLREELYSEWHSHDSILPAMFLILVSLVFGVTLTIQDHIRRSFLGPNRPVKIVIHVPVTHLGKPPGVDLGTGTEVEVKPPDPDELAAYNEWMGQAENIVVKTGDKEAKEVFSFLKERAVLATPLPNGQIQLHEVPKHPQWIAVVPFLERHKLTVHDWEKTFFYQKDTAVAYFSGGKNTSTRLIVLKDFSGLHGFSKGSTTLHEGWHAFDMLTRANPFSQKEGSYAYQHKETWAFEDRITRLMGDPTFSKLMEKDRENPFGSGMFYGRCLGYYRPDLEKALQVNGDLDIDFICSSLFRLTYPHSVIY